jgi:hypothetical protein
MRPALRSTSSRWAPGRRAFQKFRYDPDGVFSGERHDEYGFVGGECLVLAWNQGP